MNQTFTAVRPKFQRRRQASAPTLTATPRILVADDDEHVRRLVVSVLSKAGFMVDAVPDGEEAWDALCMASYDLLLTDHRMPLLLGVDLIERIRNAGIRLPVILISGTLPGDQLYLDARSPVMAVIPKPFELRHLVETVGRALQESMATDGGSQVRYPIASDAREEISPMKGSFRAATEKSANANRLPTSAPRSSMPSSEEGAKRILLADDDPGVRESLAAALRSDGYAVLPAKDGQEAIDILSASEVDLVLLDLNMPVKNGWDTCERLTAEHPLTPIIIITARPNQSFTALNAGVGALLEKPLDIPTLLGTMNALLAESAEARLARLAGVSTNFHYKPAVIGQRGVKS